MELAVPYAKYCKVLLCLLGLVSRHSIHAVPSVYPFTYINDALSSYINEFAPFLMF